MVTNKRAYEFYLIGLFIASVMIFAQSCADTYQNDDPDFESDALSPYNCEMSDLNSLQCRKK